MMPVISPADVAGPPLFVFKGSRIHYRKFFRHGVEVMETYSTHLPKIRDENARKCRRS